MHLLEQRWVEMLLARLRGGGKMVLGTFAEAVVADALEGSKLATLGTESVDLLWRGIGVHVKCTTRQPPMWDLGKAITKEAVAGKDAKRRGEVYVFAWVRGEDYLDMSSWAFYVVPRAWLVQRRTKSVRLRPLSGEFPEVPKAGIAAAVRKAAKWV